MFLMYEPEKGEMKLNLEIDTAAMRIVPSEKGTFYMVCLFCDNDDVGDYFEICLPCASIRKTRLLYDGICLIINKNVTYGSLAELEAAALSVLEGVSP